MESTHCPDRAELSRFTVGDLSRPAFARVADHVERCGQCAQVIESLDDAADPLLAKLRHAGHKVEAGSVGTVPTELASAAWAMRWKRGAITWPRKLGKFELLEELGIGSFGHVFRARDTELDRTVAIKLMRAGGLASKDDVDRFQREARSAAQLKHPGIVSLYDTGQTEDGTWYLVEEFVAGVPLSGRMAAGRFSFRKAAVLVAEIAEALAYAHQHGVIHRDVKPSNIMIDGDGRTHVMDFGLAKREADTEPMTLDGQVLGTPAYMSPEQARGEAHTVDARTDIYSLGVVLYELLTGERPFRGNRRMLILQVLQDEPRPPRQLNDKVPRDLETICLKAMAKLPGRRYATALELAEDIRRHLNDEPIRARPVGLPERVWTWSRRRPAVAGLVGVSFLASVLVVAVLGISNVQLRAEQEKTKEALSRETQAKEELLKALIQNARLTSDALTEFNALYASEVVARVRDHGIEVTHDYAKKLKAIPLPATMSLELGKRIAEHRTGMQVRLYSDAPFPWRRAEGGPRDDFEKEALQKLRASPDQPYYRFEDWHGRPSLRYATASRMRASCIDCHNSHVDSPKTNWKEGDVRGVFEVIFPVDAARPGK